MTVHEAPEGFTEAHAKQLGIAVFGCLQRFGAPASTIILDPEKDLSPSRMARARGHVILEFEADKERGRFRRIEVLRADEGPIFKIDPKRRLCCFTETGFYRPPDWTFALFADPRGWYNSTYLALSAAVLESANAH